MKPLLQTVPFLLALSLGTGAAQAQLYKWVGPDGKITYSDTPPPPAAAKVETKPIGGAASAVSTAGLPYAVAQAARHHPVTLYTSNNCGPCDDGRKLLSTRGIPFSEKTVSTNEDIEQLRKAGGDASLPLLTIGRTPQRGFEPGSWEAALTAAGYPATSHLPRNYRNPEPAPAAPRAEPPPVARQTAPATESAASPAATELPPATGNAPPGFRF